MGTKSLAGPPWDGSSGSPSKWVATMALPPSKSFTGRLVV
jgi:hypothetical protein